MNTIIKIFIASLIAMMVGCGSNGTKGNNNLPTNEENDFITFKLGDGPNYSIKNSVSFTREDFLKNANEVCIDLYSQTIDGSQMLDTIEECSPIIEKGIYPDIKIKLSEGEYNAVLIARKSIINIGQSNSKIITISKEESKVIYMGNITQIFSINSSFTIYDSTSKIDFNSISKLFLVNNKYSESRESPNQGYYFFKDSSKIITNFYLQKDTGYESICLDTDCRYIPNDLDILNDPSIDFSKLKKVPLKSIYSKSFCSVFYNQYFEEKINIDDIIFYSPDIGITDCNKSVHVKLILPKYDKLRLENNSFNSNYDDNSTNGIITKDINDLNESTYLSFSYVHDSNTPLNTIFNPKGSVIIIDPDTGNTVQTEEFNLTRFFFYKEE